MSLLYNPNWQNTKRTFMGWWNGTNTKPLLQAITPRAEPVEGVPPPPPFASVEDRSLNTETTTGISTVRYWPQASRLCFLGGVRPDEIDPLLDEFGPARLDMVCGVRSQAEAEALVERYG